MNILVAFFNILLISVTKVGCTIPFIENVGYDAKGEYLINSEEKILQISNGDALVQGDIKVCVAAHNRLRGLHTNTPPLEWDESLAAKAQAYAEQLLANHQGKTTTRLVHDKNNQKDGTGENLYWSDGSSVATCPQASLAWYNEILDYDYSTANAIHRGKPIGHFTQLVWTKTLKFGVGIASSKSRLYAKYGNIETFIVAKYTPPGNFYWNGKRLNDYTENVQPRVPGAITPTLDELDFTKKIHLCENLLGDVKCSNFIKWGYSCAGKDGEFFKKNCYQACRYC